MVLQDFWDPEWVSPWGKRSGRRAGVWPKFHKADSACHSWKGLTREEPEAQRGRGLFGRLQARQGAELQHPGLPPGQLGALSSRGLRARHG